ncbi:MAG: DUF3300 domain-containing protein, partial [Proteobacteria bacterium]|nr:DUF3300 domain-containing protein [Pseudomonadota bacterium]
MFIAVLIVMIGLLSGRVRAASSQALGAEQLDQLVAPIALFPDNLLTQVLMASAYPLEIVEADRWVQAHPEMRADARASMLAQQTWDPSVTSLTAFPDVLHQLSMNLEWTQALGEAFLASQRQVLEAVQRMRARASDAGTLQSTAQESVAMVDGAIAIAPATPEIVYVPQYNPTQVYGAWAPPYWYWPSVMAPWPGCEGSFVSFGIGVAAGAFMFGGCGWRGYTVWVNPR